MACSVWKVKIIRTPKNQCFLYNILKGVRIYLSLCSNWRMGGCLRTTQIMFPARSRTGLVRGITGTPGPVRARTTPLKSRMGPVRACPWLAHSTAKWTLPIRPRLNSVRSPYGHARGLPERILKGQPWASILGGRLYPGCPLKSRPGWAGPVFFTMVRARSNYNR